LTKKKPNLAHNIKKKKQALFKTLSAIVYHAQLLEEATPSTNA
jgi:hypothetical protein